MYPVSILILTQYLTGYYPLISQYLPSMYADTIRVSTQYLPCLFLASEKRYNRIYTFTIRYLPSIYLLSLYASCVLPAMHPVCTRFVPACFLRIPCVSPAFFLLARGLLPAFFPEGIWGRNAGSGVSTPKQFRIKNRELPRMP